MRIFYLLLLLAGIVTSRGQTIITVAGNGTGAYTGDNGPATGAGIYLPLYISFDSKGNLYIAESCHIRKVDQAGVITTCAGQASCGYSGDGGPATSAQLFGPVTLTIGWDTIFFVDRFGSFSYIRKISPSGIISLHANSGGNGLLPLSPGYLRNSGSNTIYDLAPSGTYTTYAGTGTTGFGGDGGPALAAQLYDPHGMVFDRFGNLYIADSQNHRIRKINTSGIITTVAGNGLAAFSGDGGLAINASLHLPNDLAVDSVGNLFICDSYNHRIRKVDPSGIITTIAGTGTAGFNGDGPNALLADLNWPVAAVLDSLGNLYIADRSNNRIRRLDGVGIMSLTNTELERTIQLWPNPGKMIEISSIEPIASIKIYSPIGELIFITSAFTGQLDLTTLPEGIYFFEIKTSKGTIIKKLICED
jgi:trimeric autotransporter adhesin